MNDQTRFVMLSHNDWEWVMSNLGAIEPYTQWHKRTKTMMHKIDCILMIVTMIGVLICLILNDNNYLRFMLELLPLFRLLTILSTNRDLIYVIYSVIPQFISILGLGFCFMLIWAKLGTTLFKDKSQVLSLSLFFGCFVIFLFCVCFSK